MNLKTLATSRGILLHMKPDLIQVEPGYNVRTFDQTNEDDADLLASIHMHGIKTPLTIREQNDVCYLVAGHRRLAAVMQLIADEYEIVTVPCVVEAAGTSEAHRTLDLLTSNSGLPLTPIQKAVVYKRLLTMGWNEGAIAVNAGISPQTVRNGLELLAMPEAVQAQVRENKVSAAVAVKAVREDRATAEKRIDAAAEASPTGKVKPARMKPEIDLFAQELATAAAYYVSNQAAAIDQLGVLVARWNAEHPE